MSSRSVPTYIYGLFILASYILITGSQFVVSQNYLINVICLRTNNPNWCRKVFHSRPESANARIGAMGHIAIDLATHNVSNTITTILLVEASEKRFDEFQRLARCRAKYEAVNEKLQRARQLWRAEEAHEARDVALEGIGLSTDCRNEYDDRAFPFHEKAYNVEQMLRIVGAVFDVAGMKEDDINI